MSDDTPNADSRPDRGPEEAAPDPTADMTPAARRALAEAEARRKAVDEKVRSMPKELGGRDGPEPARYGDWERKGIASDF